MKISSNQVQDGTDDSRDKHKGIHRLKRHHRHSDAQTAARAQEPEITVLNNKNRN